ncbi:MAG: L-rhamnose/proton symporter RhaT [Odoribacteraceae bacterium]|jgi:L-rhamnose-H+ transport protein|nr:L-rhamnose/proton symporter RhaT [Odoribacteraceae bacterium]
MEIITGLLIIAIGSLGQSSSYVPIKKIRQWSWESFWLVQGVFAWLIFPVLGAWLAIPADGTLAELYAAGGACEAMLHGVAWGVGGLTFGLGMRYLGVALGQTIALGTCAAFGTLLPALLKGDDLFSGEGLLLLAGVSITLAGIAIIGYAGSLRARDMSRDEKLAAIKEFALAKGLLVALVAGVTSACFALGLEAGSDIKARAISLGVNPLYAGLPVVLLVTSGGFLTNAAYCLYRNAKNHSFRDYTAAARVLLNNIAFCALAGILWYSQFFGLEAGKSFLVASPLLLAFSWCILMSLNVLFSNLWGVILKEWKGAGRAAIFTLLAGLLILVFSMVFTAS